MIEAIPIILSNCLLMALRKLVLLWMNCFTFSGSDTNSGASKVRRFLYSISTSFQCKAFNTGNRKCGVNILSKFFYVISGLIKFLLRAERISFYFKVEFDTEPTSNKKLSLSGTKFSVSSNIYPYYGLIAYRYFLHYFQYYYGLFDKASTSSFDCVVAGEATGKMNTSYPGSI